MTIEIDQSGRVEYTSHDTVVADSLGNTVVLKARDKRTLQSMYRLRNEPRKFVLDTFSLLLVILIIRTYSPESRYYIDIEYPGHDDRIRSQIQEYMLKNGHTIDESQLLFRSVGKHSLSHHYANAVFKKRSKGRTVTLEQFIEYFDPQKKDQVR